MIAIADPGLSTRPSLDVVRAGLTKNEALAAKFGTWFPKVAAKATELAQAADTKAKWTKWLFLGAGLFAAWFLFFRGGK